MGHGNGGGDQLDRAFRKGLQQNGVGVKSDEYALVTGGTVNDALNMITKKTEWSIQKSADFGGLAVLRLLQGQAACWDGLDAYELRDDGGDAPRPRFGLLRVEHGSRVLVLVGVGELVPCRGSGGRCVERGLQIVGYANRPRSGVEGEFDVDGVAALWMPDSLRRSALNGSRYLPPIGATVDRYS
jgi:hypothetical protein